ncbi:TadE family protein [Solidesulfovibrio fructosivorans JJ]]|uniref:TadE family protein n=1 Tax=Solidesulfovibrio fructosivorans JJ] TaxID=596151 RepID=E1JZK3_SOLFR|nr:TadE/TadG family type IV pilus assembly protein [Solidesulfovibrio fructosivorans]EFL50250.1 TadE family protein [Solidesulfovibrio fructosivorans JJ]]
MKRLHRDQRGLAAVEMAIAMVLLVPLLLILVEASRALTEYSQLQNAAMEGARMLARQNGETGGVEDYIKNTVLTDASGKSLFDGAEPTVTISPRDANNNVTVQVDHDYNPSFMPQYDASGNPTPFNLPGSDTLTISAKTTMALPAAN